MSLGSDTAQIIFSKYSREIEEHWKNKENQRKEYLFRSPQLSYRSQLIEWIINVCEQIKVTYKTVHLAVFILDMFMDNHSIENNRLRCVALVCIMLAAKFEEVEKKIPTISELNKFDGFRFSNKDFVKVEVMVINFHNFELAQPTIAHFVEYYGMFTVRPIQDDLKNLNISIRQIAEMSFGIIAELMVISLKELTFVHLPPSRVAAAIVLVARSRLGLTPDWTPKLIEVTNYTKEAILPCANTLLRKLHHDSLKKDKHLQSPDDGYGSP